MIPDNFSISTEGLKPDVMFGTCFIRDSIVYFRTVIECFLDAFETVPGIIILALMWLWNCFVITGDIEAYIKSIVTLSDI